MLFRTLTSMAAVFVTTVASAQIEKTEVNFDYIVKIAAQRARRPFHSPRADLPDVLKQDKLDYDNYRKIRFRADRAFWLGDNLPFRAEFYASGLHLPGTGRIFEFTKTFVQRIRFVRDWFNYSDLKIENKIPAETGYAGFKIAYPINKPGDYAEIASFLGASYFRMLGKISVTALPPVGWRWIAAKPIDRRNSRSSRIFGSANRKWGTAAYWSMPFWIA